MDQPGERLFSVDINGERRITDWDRVGETGSDHHATVRSLPVTVENGELTVDLIQNVQNPKPCGLKILDPRVAPLGGAL